MSKKEKKSKRDKNALITHENAPTVQTPTHETIAPITPEICAWQKNINDFVKSWDLWTEQAKATAEPVMVKEAYRTRNHAVYFEYADIGRLPVVRSLELNKLLIKLKFAITEEYLSQLKSEISEAAAKNDTARILALNKDLFDRAAIAPEIPTMLELAALFFIRHDENPYTFNPIIHGQKVRDAQKDYNLQAFFLGASWQIIKETAPTYLKLWNIGNEAAFQDYLQGKVATRPTN